MDWFCMHIMWHCTIEHVFFHTDIGTFMEPAGALTSFLLYMAGASIPSSCTFEIHSIFKSMQREKSWSSIISRQYIDIMILWPLITLIKNIKYPNIIIAQIIISSLHFVDLGWWRRSRGFCLSRVWRGKIAFSSAQEKGYCRFCKLKRALEKFPRKYYRDDSL